MAAAARGLVLVRELLLRPQGTTTHRLRGMAVGLAAGFLGSASVASASDGGAAACPAYPWPPQDGARGGAKVFMQSDCAACHSMLPYSVHTTQTEATAVEAKAADIVLVHEAEAARPPPPPPGSAACCPPDLSVIATMLQGRLRRSNLYNGDELKTTAAAALPSPAWMQFFQPYTRRTPHAA